MFKIGEVRHNNILKLIPHLSKRWRQLEQSTLRYSSSVLCRLELCRCKKASMQAKIHQVAIYYFGSLKQAYNTQELDTSIKQAVVTSCNTFVVASLRSVTILLIGVLNRLYQGTCYRFIRNTKSQSITL